MFVLLVELMIANSIEIFVLLDNLEILVKSGITGILGILDTLDSLVLITIFAMKGIKLLSTSEVIFITVWSVYALLRRGRGNVALAHSL